MDSQSITTTILNLPFPFNERVNGLLVVRKLKTKYTKTNKGYNIECICWCGNTVLRSERSIRDGSVFPCDKCIKKYKIY